MKIVFVGQLSEGQTSRMRMEVLRELGHSVVAFDAQRYWDNTSKVSRIVQKKICSGPFINALNKDLL